MILIVFRKYKYNENKEELYLTGLYVIPKFHETVYTHVYVYPDLPFLRRLFQKGNRWRKFFDFKINRSDSELFNYLSKNEQDNMLKSEFG
ncbi:MAG: hypothetical protein LBE71_01320 [Dysgonamonadaceae bacterium]|nr:hypothetical protein [Dysgonamonadaceae bacterium]